MADEGKVYAPLTRGRFPRVYVFPPTAEDREPYPLEHHVHHSPDGHSWGYGGSGPSELAKDILWDLLGEQPDPRLYQDFKDAFIATIDQDSNTWRITEADIRSWLTTNQPASAGSA